ncbi:MAG TPA: hypothetical protein VGC79_14095 [Polyangiaceae bacterium]
MGALFKFGAKTHMEQFLEEGLLYMHTLNWFSEVEDEALRADPNEGLLACWQSALVTVHFGQRVTGDTAPIRRDFTEHPSANVFCMYSYGLQSAWIDPKNHRSREMCAVIHKREAFIERLVAAFEAQSWFNRLQVGSVRYVEPGIHPAEANPFQKTLAYSYQHEFRIALSPALADPCQFRIGDLTDIGFLMQANTVNRIPMHENLLPPKRA